MGFTIKIHGDVADPAVERTIANICIRLVRKAREHGTVAVSGSFDGIGAIDDDFGVDPPDPELVENDGIPVDQSVRVPIATADGEGGQVG